MDDQRFDDLARALTGAGSRRAALGLALGGLLATLELGETAATKKRKGGQGKGKQKGNGKGKGGGKGHGGGNGKGKGKGNGNNPPPPTSPPPTSPPSSCDSPCKAPEVCHASGSCGCPNGTKHCPGDVFGLCHECCPGSGGGLFDPECNDSPNGEHCVDRNHDNIYLCGCLEAQETCGDGTCVACCSHQRCRQLTNDDFRFCIGGRCLCDETAGFFECPDPSFHEGLCKYIAEDAHACGPRCDRCPSPLVCRGGRCCVPTGESCDDRHRSCCSGELNCGPGFICA